MNRKPLMAVLGVLAIVAVASTPAAAASAPTPVEAGLDARWYHNAWPQNPLPAICMNPGATGTYNAGEANNDKMSMLWIYTNSTTC